MFLRIIISALLFSCASACTDYGPYVIRKERLAYSDAVHDTSAELLLLNIIRTSKNESTTFSDTTGYDSTPRMDLTLGGSATGFGGALVGSATPGLLVSQQSVQKTNILTGQQLAQQISSPLTLRSIRRLSLAAEPNIPLFRFTISRIGPTVDYNRVLHILDFLDSYGALLLESRTENILTASLEDGFVRDPNASIKADKRLECFASNNARQNVTKFWYDLTTILGQPGKNKIIFRTADANISTNKDKSNELDIAKLDPHGTVLVSTGTALGALRQSTDEHTFYILTQEQADEFLSRNNNLRIQNPRDCGPDSFYLKDTEKYRLEELWKFLYTFPFQEPDRAREMARNIGAGTVLVLIRKSSTPPTNAYISVEKDGTWHSIANEDRISKKNFALLANILNIQAAPVNNAPTQTAIAIGAGR